MIRGAIFDMDGTLLDSMSAWDQLGPDYLLRKGIQPPAHLREILQPLDMQQMAACFQETFGVTDSAQTIIDEVNQMITEFYEQTAPLKPGVKEFLLRLKAEGVKMCVATATDRPLVEAALNHCGVLDLFEFLITCTEAGSGKEQPDIFLKALEQLGTPMEETLVFEDAPHAIQTAARAGFRVIGVRDPVSQSVKGSQQALGMAERILDRYEDCEVDSL